MEKLGPNVQVAFDSRSLQPGNGNLSRLDDLKRNAAPQIDALLAAYRHNFPDVGVDDNTAITLAARERLIDKNDSDSHLRGFAIDLLTKSYLVTARYAKHKLAGWLLAEQLIREFGLGVFPKERDRLRTEIIPGTLITKPTGFKAEIVVFSIDFMSSARIEELRKVGSYLLREKLFIPVTSNMDLIDENYNPC